MRQERIKRIIEWSKGNLLPPCNIDFLLTSKCNLKCRFCRFGTEKRKIDYSRDLTHQEILRVVNEGLNLGIKEWFIEGGEPLYYSDVFLQIMEMIKKYDTFGNVNTNGTLFNDNIIKKVLETGWDEVTFSIDSANPKIHDELRGVPGTFEKAVTAIKKIQKMKKLLQKNEPKINIHSVITNKNYNSLDEIIKLAHKLKVKDVLFTHLFKMNKHFNELSLKKKHINGFEINVKKAYELSLKYHMNTNLKDYIKTIRVKDLGKMDILLKARSRESNNKILSIPCFEPWYQIIILNDGKVGYCGRYSGNAKSENVRSKKLKDIWYGKNFEKIRRKIIMGKLPKFCRVCPTSRILRNENLRNDLKNILSNKYSE